MRNQLGVPDRLATFLVGLVVVLAVVSGCSTEPASQPVAGITATGNTGKITGTVRTGTGRIDAGARAAAGIDSNWVVKVFLMELGKMRAKDSVTTKPGSAYVFDSLAKATYKVFALCDQSGWYSDTASIALDSGETRSAPMEVAPPLVTTSVRNGMTWGKRKRDSAMGIDFLHCNVPGMAGCNATAGDHPCTSILPILCTRKTGASRPAYRVDYPNNGSMDSAYYAGWLEGEAAFATRIAGTSLRSKAAADSVCVANLGADWHMAGFHEGLYVKAMDSTHYFGSSWTAASKSGGAWGFYATTDNLPMNTRFWVHIDDQAGNCWDP